LIDGDPASLTWSIGGEQSTLLGLTGLLGKPQGLSGSHNKYESDSSPTRGDSYTHGGDVSSLQLDMFQHLYGLQPGDSGGNYDLGVLTEQARWSIQKSRAENPQCKIPPSTMEYATDFLSFLHSVFWGPFSGIIVSVSYKCHHISQWLIEIHSQQAAFSFIPAFMSNHSAEVGVCCALRGRRVDRYFIIQHPEGILDQNVLKSFFAVSGTQGKLSYQKGYERIP
jgi:hypothetical protein